MARPKIRLDSKGVSAILKGQLMQRAIKVKAEQVATKVRAQGITVGDDSMRDRVSHEIPLPVEVETGVSDRARASVTISHPAGQAVQAKHGSLTKAAAQSGLEVRGKK